MLPKLPVIDWMPTDSCLSASDGAVYPEASVRVTFVV